MIATTRYHTVRSLSEAKDISSRINLGTEGPMRNARTQLTLDTLADLGIRAVTIEDAEFPTLWFNTDMPAKGFNVAWEAVWAANYNEMLPHLTAATAGVNA